MSKSQRWGRRKDSNRAYPKSDITTGVADLRSRQKDLEIDLRGTRRHITNLSNEVNKLERKIRVSKRYEEDTKKYLQKIKNITGMEKETKTLEKRLEKNKDDIDRYTKKIKENKANIKDWEKEVSRIQRDLDVVYKGLGKMADRPPTRR